MWKYILALVVFFAVFSLLQKMQKKTYAGMEQKAKQNDPLKGLGAALGLQYELLQPSPDKNAVLSTGSRLSGTYQGLPIEMIYGQTTRTENFTSRYTASYTLQRTITVTVENKNRKQFEILPRAVSGTGGTPTGNQAFDAKLLVMGEAHNLPSDFVQYCASLGWMHLSLKDNRLHFEDTFYDQFTGLSGMQMMTAVHPIWKTSVSKPEFDMAAAKTFFDELTKLAKSIG